MSEPSSATKPPVNTGKVAGRRELHFHNFREVLADAERLSQGNYTCLGNWSLGQVCKHLAEGIHMTIDGVSFKVPLIIRLIGPLFLKRRILSKGMSPGIKLPPSAAKQLIPAETSTEEGLKALRFAIERLESEEKRAPSPFLGKLTREESDQVQLRHAELHLSFVVPK